MSRRTVFFVFGIATVAVATAMAIDPALAAVVDAHFILLLMLGGAMIAIGYVRYTKARGTDRRHRTVEDTEDLPAIAVPGSAIDASWDEYRLTTLAIAVLCEEMSCDAAQARSLLESGAWTDDPLAAAYFSTRITPPSRLDRLLGRLRRSRDRTEERQMAVKALSRMVGLEGEHAT